MKLAIFDVCDTLYYSNTTHDFVRYLMVGRGVLARARVVYRVCNSKWLPLRYLLIGLSVVSGWDALKVINLRLIAPVEQVEIEDQAERFVDEYLSLREVKTTHELVSKYRDAGCRVVLCSSSIDPVVNAVARRLNIADWLSTELEYSKGGFRGRIKSELVGNKLAAVTDAFPDEEIEVVVSDNWSDRDLMAAGKQAIVVLHQGKNGERWNGFDFDRIIV